MIRAFSFASVAVLCLVACSSSSSDTPVKGGGGSASSAGATGSAGMGGAIGAGGSTGVSGSGSAAAGTSNAAAGSIGTGGSSVGSAGTGGAPGTAGSTSAAGATSTGCTGMALCDDFEADTAGTAPAGWTLFKPGGCSGSAAYSANIDTTQSHSGSKSVKVTGGDSCGPMLVNTAAFAKLSGGEVYGRFYVRMPSFSTTVSHAVMAALGLQGGIGSSTSYNQASNLSLSVEPVGTDFLYWQTDDGHISPSRDTAGAAQTTLPKSDTWTCIEFHVSSSTNALETWVDGMAVPGLTFVADMQAKGWPNITPTALGLGWIDFSSSAYSLYFDDAALGTTRIGCN